MRLLFTACTKCGAPSSSAIGLCSQCESREPRPRPVAKHRILEQVRSTRAS